MLTYGDNGELKVVSVSAGDPEPDELVETGAVKVWPFRVADHRHAHVEVIDPRVAKLVSPRQYAVLESGNQEGTRLIDSYHGCPCLIVTIFAKRVRDSVNRALLAHFDVDTILEPSLALIMRKFDDVQTADVGFFGGNEWASSRAMVEEVMRRFKSDSRFHASQNRTRLQEAGGESVVLDVKTGRIYDGAETEMRLRHAVPSRNFTQGFGGVIEEI